MVYLLISILLFLISISNIFIGKKKFKFLICMITIVLMALCFYIVPGDLDIYRHYNQIDKLRFEGFNTILIYDTLYSFKVLLYLISLTNYNVLLPMISLLIVMVAFFKSIEYVSSKNKYCYSDNIYALYALFAFCSFGTLFSGIRNILSFSLIFIGYILYLNKRKISILLLYFIPAIFIHQIAIIPIVCFLFTNIFLKDNFKTKFYVYLFFIMLSILVMFNQDYISTIFFKFEYYLYYESSRKMGNLLLLFLLFISLYIITINKKRIDDFKNIKEFYFFTKIYITITIISYFFVSMLFVRLSFFMIFLMPLILYCIRKSKKNIFNILINNMYLIVIILFSLYYMYYNMYIFIN